MKIKSLLLSLLVLLVLVVGVSAEWYGEDSYLGGLWLKEVHNPAFPAPGGMIWMDNISDGVALRGQSDHGVGIEAISDSSGLALRAQGTSYFDGPVGIGTDTPVAELTIAGDMLIDSGINDNHIYWTGHHMTLGTRPGVWAHNFLHLKPGGSTSGFCNSLLLMYTADYSDSITFDNTVKITAYGNSFLNGGNVGIGTNIPDYKLDVEGDVQAHSFITGDITFQKDKQKLWRMFEDEDGLYLESMKTGKVYSFVLKEIEKE